MPSEVKTFVSQAQAAEVRGDKREAIRLLRRAAELYRDLNNANQALRMLRHARRLEGVAEPDDEDGPLAQAPVAAAPSLWSVDDAGGAPATWSLEDDARALEDEVRAGRRRVLEERAATLSAPDLEAWCSFCCKPDREVGRLVAGPAGAYLCAACVEVAAGLLAQAGALRPPRESGEGSVDLLARAGPPGDAAELSRAGAVPGARAQGGGAGRRALAEADGPGVRGEGTPVETSGAPRDRSAPPRAEGASTRGEVGSAGQSASKLPAPMLAPHLRAHAQRLLERAPRVALIIGPSRTGKSALLQALATNPSLLVVEVDGGAPAAQELAIAAHLERSPEHRAVLAVRATPPAPALTVEGAQGPEPIYDTASLSAAVGGALSQALLERVDAVVALEPFTGVALDALAVALLEEKGAVLAPAARDTLVAIAQRTTRPVDELVALIGRVPRARR